MSDPPINSPLMKICGMVGQWVYFLMPSLISGSARTFLEPYSASAVVKGVALEHWEHSSSILLGEKKVLYSFYVPYESRILHAMLLNPHMGASGIPFM